ncbi:hypothetical protein EDB84DRAFT_1443041 [Lactarius hengduanensis]|nr:hypothetical protein EDB84DRAFT_1443041 [Lactarius hengduanensis]
MGEGLERASLERPDEGWKWEHRQEPLLPPRARSPPPLVPAPTRRPAWLATPRLRKMEDVAEDELGFGPMHKMPLPPPHARSSPPLVPAPTCRPDMARNTRPPPNPPRRPNMARKTSTANPPPRAPTRPSPPTPTPSRHGAHDPATQRHPPTHRHPDPTRHTKTLPLPIRHTLPQQPGPPTSRHLDTARTTPPLADSPPRRPTRHAKTAPRRPATRFPNAARDHNHEDEADGDGVLTMYIL